MAIRVNVTAVRGCSVDELRAVMSEVIRPACAGTECAPVGDELEIQEHGGWAWFNTSVWGVSASDLNRGLCRLGRPALQFTTSDGDRWYLTIHGGPRGQVYFLHEFAYHSHAPDPDEDGARQAQLDDRPEPTPVDPRLAFLEDDPLPEPDRPRAPFDLLAACVEAMGAKVPDEFRARVAHLPYSAAVNQYRRWHAEQLSNALAEAGVAHDEAAVRSALLWDSVTENERDSDLGNLPRLLSVLGLGGEWDEWVRQAETPPAPPEPESPDEPQEEAAAPPQNAADDPFEPVLAVTRPLRLTAVAGGPFSLPLGELTLVRFFVEALSIHATAGVVMRVSLPSDAERNAAAALTGAANGTVEVTDTGFRFAHVNHVWFNRSDLANLLGEGLAHVLDQLPDGSKIDLAFAREGLSALTQRYRGRVAGGAWQITETYPALTRAALSEGMDLARYAATDPEEHALRSEAEAEAVVELARRDPNLWDLRVERKGVTVRCKSDIVGHLPKAIFRHRCAEFWDVAAHDREAARQYEQRLDMQRKMRRAGAEAARRRSAPHDDEVLFQGRLGPYWRSDFARLEQLEQETRARIDDALADLGFRHVGDLVGKKQRDVVARVYASSDAFSYGILLGKRIMYLGLEFFSRFTDGSTLTTTTNGSLESRPEHRVYVKFQPGLEPVALYGRHQWGIERFRTLQRTEPLPLAQDLAGVACEYDQALALRL
jgi:hypothetical protein